MKKEIKKFGKLKLNKETLSMLKGGEEYQLAQATQKMRRRKSKKKDCTKHCPAF